MSILRTLPNHQFAYEYEDYLAITVREFIAKCMTSHQREKYFASQSPVESKTGNGYMIPFAASLSEADAIFFMEQVIIGGEL